MATWWSVEKEEENGKDYLNWLNRFRNVILLLNVASCKIGICTVDGLRYLTIDLNKGRPNNYQYIT